MKRKLSIQLTVLILTCMSFNVRAQMIAMFVNDNSLYYPNTEAVLASLQQNPLIDSIVYFNAVDSMRSPTYSEMIGCFPVIWYTSTDGVGRYLWNGTDSDNTELMLYMQEGGMLWVMGTDFLYDRYGVPPVEFSSGDFAFDYLGIGDYAVQSYGDDGNSGVALLTHEDNGLISGPDTLRWIYETLWWVDGCLPTDNGVPFYKMGPDDYILSAYHAAIIKTSISSDITNAISMFFDPALIDTESNRDRLFNGVVDYIRMFIPYKTSSLKAGKETFELFPNPASGSIHLTFTKTNTCNASTIALIAPDGRLIRQFAMNGTEAEFSLTGLPAGVYVVQSENAHGKFTRKLIVY